MISVDEALARIFALIDPVGTEQVDLRSASGRVLRTPVIARRDQPPHAMSAMDGYAVRSVDTSPGASLRVAGEAAAGHGPPQTLSPGQAIRIFTGAPVPAGADRVVIQEDVTRTDDQITIAENADPGPYIRPAGGDFAAGWQFDAPRRLGPADLSLIAAMNVGRIEVSGRPRVALLATGDELRPPGSDLGPGQIVASNGIGLAAMLEREGAEVQILPLAPDDETAIAARFDLAQDADLIVTIGGASVGDHDLVRKVGQNRGLELSFDKVAMRPGKPTFAGRMGTSRVIGVPGNPVSALVCCQIFVLPALRAMLGLPQEQAQRQQIRLAAPIPANGPREHYMRAVIGPGGIRPADRQDSSLLTVLASADALLRRPPKAPAAETGTLVDYVPLAWNS